MAVLFITHDMGVVAEVADRVAVMLRGEKVEEGTAEAIFARPREPYTRNLIAAVPRLGALSGEDAPRKIALPGAPTRDAPARRVRDGARPILRVRDLSTRFDVKAGFLSRVTPARARGRERELRSRGGRDARARRRIGLRQVDDRPLAPAAGRAPARQHRVRGPRHREALPPGDAGGPARHPDDLPGSVRLARSAPHRRVLDRRAAAHPRRRARARGGGARRRAARARRPRARARAALSARVLGRAAPAHRDRARARAAARR